jgi:ADP-ribose pyrophosphatase YjhB (NUDIX family)
MFRKLLLHLWRVVPFPKKLRYRFLWTINQKFIVGVGVLVVDEQERVLLFKHSYRSEYPWGLPSGWLQAGETPMQAVEREVYEESGYRVKVLRPFEVNTGEPGIPNLHLVFLGELVEETEFIGSSEVVEAKFFSQKDMPVLIPDQVKIIRKFFEVKR